MEMMAFQNVLLKQS